MLANKLKAKLANIHMQSKIQEHKCSNTVIVNLLKE